MYDQQAVHDAIVSTGRQGAVSAACAIAGGGAAVYVASRQFQALYSPAEAREMLESVVTIADEEGWLHNGHTLFFIAQVNDLAKAVDDQHPMTGAEVTEKFRGWTPQNYNFEEDPEAMRGAIQEIYEEA